MLIDIDNAVVAHVQRIFAGLDAQNYPATKVQLTLVDDRHSHLRQIEKMARDAGIETTSEPARRFPAVLVYRKASISRVNVSTSSKAAERDMIISQASDGSCVLGDWKQVTLEYSILQYTTSFEELTRMQEYWWLNIGQSYTLMQFSFSEPELQGATWDGNIRYLEPESVRPVRDEIENSGSVFVQSFPFDLATLVIGNIRDDNEIILTTQLNIHVLLATDIFPTS